MNTLMSHDGRAQRRRHCAVVLGALGLAALSLLAACRTTGGGSPAARKESPMTPRARTGPRLIVSLGDSITDGHTYPLLVQQALREAGKPVPIWIGAGVGGDVASGMLRRLDDDVLSFKPDLVFLMTGINDMGGGVPLADFERDVAAIAGRVTATGTRLTLLTVTTVGPRAVGLGPKLVEANDALRRVAMRYGCGVGDVYAQMLAAGEQDLWEEDDCHLNYEGYRLVARAVLDVMGYADVPLPDTFKPPVLPGLVRQWRIKAVADGEPPLDEARVARLTPDASWVAYNLPETRPQEGWWWEQERQRGFALSLKEVVGPAKAYRGFAVVSSPKARQAWLNTGAGLSQVWLNGKRIPLGTAPKGWHAGGYRVPVQLQAGVNRLVIESGEKFVLTITDSRIW